MAEFGANATSMVGNFMGPCLIYLNGESITVKRADKLEIAKWPYVVIRQFRAEEEQGRFSFVSGRRGPYGVAEYNFQLSTGMLLDLQEALTQFTGAQFSSVAPGSGSGENPPPVPTSHRPNPLHPASSVTSINSVGLPTAYERGRGSTSSEPSFSSPSHSRGGPPPVLTGPRLPPRDYLPSPLQQGISPPIRSEDGRYIRSPGGYQRPADSTEYNTIPDRYSKPHSPPTQSQIHNPHASTHSQSSNARVLSSTYDTRKPIPRPKSEPTSGNLGGKISPLPEEQDTLREAPKLPPKYIPASQAPPTEDKPYTESKKGYDRLHALGPENKTEQVPSTHRNPGTNVAGSEEYTSLDFHTRYSPLLRAKSPKEELLRRIHSVEEEGDVVINKSPTIKGRRSPDERLKRSQTERVISPVPLTYDIPSNKKMAKQYSVDNVELDSHYHVPKPARNQQEYHVPIPSDNVRNRGDYYHQPKPAEETYKVPVPHTRNGTETYDSPRQTHQTPPSHLLYNTPNAIKKELNETGNFYANFDGHSEKRQQENFYNVPPTPPAGKAHAVLGQNSQQASDNLYNVPPKRVGSEKSNRSVTDLVDGGSPLRLHKLRPARSAESLFTHRITHSDSVNSEPPLPSSVANEHNMYVDIEQNRQAPPAADNLYAEIPADYIPRLGQKTSNGGGESVVPQPSESTGQRNSGAELYDQVPNRMSTQIQNQRKLTRDGYELCLPAEVNPNSLHMMTLPGRGKRSSATPPRILGDKVSSLDKYDIHMPAVRSSTRRRSEADLIDNFEKSGSSHGGEDVVLGSSIPADSTFPVTDEYVIITHRDTRPKFPPTQSQGILGEGVSRVPLPQSTGELEEYQTMTAAKADRSKFLYDTPDPSLLGNGHQSSSSQLRSDLVQDVQYDILPSTASHLNSKSHFDSESRLDSESSLDMEGVSPRSSRPMRSLSFGSPGLVFNDQEPEVEDQNDHVTDEGVAIPQKARMRIASGSPNDATASMNIKNCSRSLGNVLDHDVTKKHSYVNVKENVSSSSIEQKIRDSSLLTAAQKKPPKPLPKPNFLAPNQEDMGRRGYESVDLSKVKGNAHPLSSGSTSSM